MTIEIIILAFFLGHFVGWYQQEKLIEGYHRVWLAATKPKALAEEET